MDQVTLKYHQLLLVLDQNTITTLERMHASHAKPHAAEQRIHSAQIQASSLGSQLGYAQLDTPQRPVYTPIKPIIIAASITLGMLTVVARTAIIDAYRESTIAVYAANNVNGWIWVVDSGPCDFCLSMNGTIHLLTEKFESHNNCRCTTKPA